MPEIKVPEVRLPRIELPDLRAMSREDIQKAMPEVRLPQIELPKRSDVQKELEKQIDKNMPRKAGPSPVPFAILAMLGGLIVGWLLATSPTTAPKISAAMDGVRGRLDKWKNGRAETSDEYASGSTFAESMRSPMEPEPYAGSFGTTSTYGSADTVGVGPGRPPQGLGTEPEGVSSERF